MKTDQNKSFQTGWTTMEYVVGAIIIISIVSFAINQIQEGIKSKAEKVKTQLQSE